MTEPLFPPSLIPPEITANLQSSPSSGIIIRPLQKNDFSKGYLDCLRVLTWVGDLTDEEWSQRYDEMASAMGTYYLLAMEDTTTNRIIGTGSLIVERKLYVVPTY